MSLNNSHVNWDTKNNLNDDGSNYLIWRIAVDSLIKMNSDTQGQVVSKNSLITCEISDIEQITTITPLDITTNRSQLISNNDVISNYDEDNIYRAINSLVLRTLSIQGLNRVKSDAKFEETLNNFDPSQMIILIEKYHSNESANLVIYEKVKEITDNIDTAQNLILSIQKDLNIAKSLSSIR